MRTVRSPLGLALAAVAVGVITCGVTYAFAGESRHKPPDPLLPLPPDVVVYENRQNPCDAAAAAGIDSSGMVCWRSVAVQSTTGETAQELADRTAHYYELRGITMSTVPDAEGNQAYKGLTPNCAGTIYVSTSLASMYRPPGTGSLIPNSSGSPFAVTPSSSGDVLVPDSGSVGDPATESAPGTEIPGSIPDQTFQSFPSGASNAQIVGGLVILQVEPETRDC